jgi:hypothetical protein
LQIDNGFIIESDISDQGLLFPVPYLFEVPMSYRKLILPAFVAAAGMAALVGSLAIADAAK